MLDDQLCFGVIETAPFRELLACQLTCLLCGHKWRSLRLPCASAPPSRAPRAPPAARLVFAPSPARNSRLWWTSRCRPAASGSRARAGWAAGRRSRAARTPPTPCVTPRPHGTAACCGAPANRCCLWHGNASAEAHGDECEARAGAHGRVQRCVYCLGGVHDTQQQADPSFVSTVLCCQ